MLYLDANFFIFALLDKTSKGGEARKILVRIVEGKDTAMTSSLALDEIMRILIKNNRKHLLRFAIEGIYHTPNLDVVDVSPSAPLSALDFIEKYGLKPRDAFHLAIMKENRAETIVTDDKDFEKVEWVKRIG